MRKYKDYKFYLSMFIQDHYYMYITNKILKALGYINLTLDLKPK